MPTKETSSFSIESELHFIDAIGIWSASGANVGAVKALHG